MNGDGAFGSHDRSLRLTGIGRHDKDPWNPAKGGDMPPTDLVRTAIVAYEGVSLLDLSGPLESFRIASTHPNHVGGSRTYDCTVVSVHGGPVVSADGVSIVTEPVRVLDGRTIDTLIVPGACSVDDVRRDRELTSWVRRRAPDCRRVCSVCVGAFLLAEAGLLNGRRVVTHWMHCGLLASSYPDLTVEPDAIYIRDGAIWSSAGVTTGIDLALALVEEDCGRIVAMHVARVLVVYLRRAGGQSQYSALLAAQVESASDEFAELERWIAGNLTADLRMERLAERVGMSPRNFARRYTETRKRTPARAVESIRVDAARRALEETDDRIDDIARRCGFSSEEQLRGVFARHVGISPRAYRDRFAVA
jgi:transcriptional regulator GlxA family with amidase domain